MAIKKNTNIERLQYLIALGVPKSEAARQLGISRTTVYYYVKKGLVGCKRQARVNCLGT